MRDKASAVDLGPSARSKARGIGLAIGISFVLVLGAVSGNFAVGLIFGIAIGTSLGTITAKRPGLRTYIVIIGVLALFGLIGYLWLNVPLQR